MRKQTKVAVVVSAAALLAMGASMTSFAAAKGWQPDDEGWVYLDSEGERVYGEWKKSEGNYYWLDEETGVMATNRLVEDEDGDLYYVKADGTRTVLDWVEVENEDGEEINGVTPDTIWYYFGSNGKAYKLGDNATTNYAKKSINDQTYFFDDNGYMQFGWIDYEYEKDGKDKVDTYYCGNEDDGLTTGIARKGWQYMEPTEDMSAGPSGEYADEEWFYFGTSGKLVTDDTEYIHGHYYTFDVNGVMEDDWYTAGVSTSADVATSAKAYANANGVLGNGWVKATDDDDNSNWYYMVTVRSNDGKNAYRAVPFNAGESGYRAKYIGGKTYLFDGEGKMVTGLINIKAGTEKHFAPGSFDGVTHKVLEDGIYYFEKDGSNEGAMKTGKVSVTTDDVIDYYYMKDDGTAITNTMKDGVIYGDNGKRIQAEDGNTYQRVTLSDYVVGDVKDFKNQNVTAIKPTEGDVIVSATGKVRTSGKVKIDGESYEIEFDKDTKVYEIKDAD